MARNTGHGEILCPECGERFATTHHRQSFCSDAHKKAFHQRTRQRGQVIATLVQAWRLGRNTKEPTKTAAASAAFAEFCALADKWNAEDLAAGRLAALPLVIRQSALGFRDPLPPPELLARQKKAKALARPRPAP